jgi:hypothetical protein
VTRRRVPLRIGQQAGQARLFGDQLLQAFGVGARVARQKVRVRHHALGTASIGEGDGPVPDVAELGVHRNPDLLTVKLAPKGHVVLHVREDGTTHREVGRVLQIQQARQRPAKAAGIEQEGRY